MNKIMAYFFLIIPTFAFAQNEKIKPIVKFSEPVFQGRYISNNDSLELNRLIDKAQHYYLSQRMHLTQAQFFTEVDTAYTIADSALKFARKNIISGDHPDLATSIDHMGLIFHGRQKYDKAEPLYLEALEMRRRMYKSDHPDLESSLGKLALFYFYQNRIYDAEKFFLDAIEMNRRIYQEDNLSLAKNMLNLASIYANLDFDDKALGLFNQAIEMQRRIFKGDHEDLGWSIRSLAFYYEDTGRLSEAKAFYEEMLAMRRRLHSTDHPNLAVNIDDVAKFYRELGLCEKAETLNREALAMRKRLYKGDHPGLAFSLGNIARLYEAMGNYSEAELHYLESLNMHRRIYGKDNRHLLSAIRDIGIFYRGRGRYTDAEPYYEEALAMARRIYKGDHPEVASCLNNSAVLSYYQGNFAKAESLNIEALEIRRRIFHSDHPNLASSICNTGVFFESSGQNSVAEKLYEEALSMYRRLYTNDHPRLAATLNIMANFYNNTGRAQEAEPLYIESLEMRKRLFDYKHDDLMQSYASYSQYLTKQNRYMEAKNLLDKLMEGVRAAMDQSFGFESEMHQLNFLNKVLKPYLNNYARFCINYHSKIPDLAGDFLNALLAFKGAIANESARINAHLMKSPEAFKLSEELTKLRERDAWFASQIQDSTILHQRKIISHRADSLDAALRRLDRQYDQFRIDKEIGWRDIQSRLKNNEILIEFAAVSFPTSNRRQSDSTYYVAVGLRNTGKPQIIKLGSENLLSEYLNQEITIDNPSYIIDKDISKRLYTILWQPIETMLSGVYRIFIVPDGALHRLAFAALVKNDSGTSPTYLDDHYMIQQLTSGREIVDSTELRADKKTDEFILIGNPAFSIDSVRYKNTLFAMDIKPMDNSMLRSDYSNDRSRPWLSLPGTAKEIEEISSLCNRHNVPYQSFIGSDAIEEQVKILSGSPPRVLHIATHGFFYPIPRFISTQNENLLETQAGGLRLRLENNPMLRAGLVFAGVNRVWKGGTQIEGIDDGILTGLEISRLNLNGTEMVTLSACQTALGDVTNVEGVFGLQRAFKVAGVNSILMSLWKVDDKATSEMMHLFYSFWLRGKSKTEAFRYARQEMRKKYINPYYWAAFVLVGYES